MTPPPGRSSAPICPRGEADMATFFVMFSTDPDVDPRKCVVGLACAAQAVADGHQVQAFFASHAVRLVMQSIAQNLTDNDIEALANYMHGLYQ